MFASPLSAAFSFFSCFFRVLSLGVTLSMSHGNPATTWRNISSQERLRDQDAEEDLPELGSAISARVVHGLGPSMGWVGSGEDFCGLGWVSKKWPTTNSDISDWSEMTVEMLLEPCDTEESCSSRRQRSHRRRWRRLPVVLGGSTVQYTVQCKWLNGKICFSMPMSFNAERPNSI